MHCYKMPLDGTKQSRILLPADPSGRKIKLQRPSSPRPVIYEGYLLLVSIPDPKKQVTQANSMYVPMAFIDSLFLGGGELEENSRSCSLSMGH
jgi:hypothetical protein